MASYIFAACGSGPSDQGRVVFLLGVFDGDLYAAGLGEPDNVCQEVAEIYGLPGNYAMWISAPDIGSPSSRFTKTPNVGYYLLSATADNLYITAATVANSTIAINNAEFYSDSHRVPIDRLPDGLSMVPGPDVAVWTNTNPNGTMAETAINLHCNSWASDDGSLYGVGGDYTSVDLSWTNVTPGAWTCDMAGFAYCVQQDTTTLDQMLLP